MEPVTEALLKVFEIVIDALVVLHPPDALKQKIDDAAARRAEAAADLAEDLKFGGK